MSGVYYILNKYELNEKITEWRNIKILVYSGPEELNTLSKLTELFVGKTGIDICLVPESKLLTNMLLYILNSLKCCKYSFPHFPCKYLF